MFFLFSFFYFFCCKRMILDEKKKIQGYTYISNIGHVRKEEESSGRVNLPASVGATINRASDNHSGFMVTTDYQVVQGGIFHIATFSLFQWEEYLFVGL